MTPIRKVTNIRFNNILLYYLVSQAHYRISILVLYGIIYYIYLNTCNNAILFVHLITFMLINGFEPGMENVFKKHY